MRRWELVMGGKLLMARTEVRGGDDESDVEVCLQHCLSCLGIGPVRVDASGLAIVNLSYPISIFRGFLHIVSCSFLR